MNRRLKGTMVGLTSFAVAAMVATTLLMSGSDERVGTPIVVPQAQDATVDFSKPPQTSVSVLLPLPPIGPTTSAPPAPPTTSERRNSLMTTPQPVTATRPAPVTVELQAEDAKIYNGTVMWNHTGFTGTGFVDYANAAGGSVEWTVTAAAASGTDVVFRFANGSSAGRPMVIAVNGAYVASVVFPVTSAWEDWQTLTVHLDLPAGTDRIRVIAAADSGGPNLDKITVSLPAAGS